MGLSHSKQDLKLWKADGRLISSRVAWNRKRTYWMKAPTSMKNMMISFSRVTFLKNNWRLNFASCWTSFSSFGSSTRIAAFIAFHSAVSSNWICGDVPLARVVTWNIAENSFTHQIFSFMCRKFVISSQPYHFFALNSTTNLYILTVFVFQRVPSLLSVANAKQGNHDTPQKLHFMVSVLVENCHIEHRRHVLDVAACGKQKMFLTFNGTLTRLAYNVNILFQFGVNVLYSVCVCNLLLTSSRTQNGSDLPPMSADARPVALKTMMMQIAR